LYNGKYYRLFEFLNQKSSEVTSYTTTINEIEEIIQFKLPKSAYKHSAWWANEVDGNHTQARSWLLAGWKTADVKPGISVAFYR
jgi:hypothetical protein